MGAIQSLSDLLNKMTGANSGNPQHIFWFKNVYSSAGGLPTNPIAGTMYDLWQMQGMPSNTSALPTASVICDNTTTGSLWVNNPQVGKNYLVGGTAFSSNFGTIIIYDRLAHMAGLSGTSTANQQVSMSALTRYTGSSAVGNRAYVTIPTAIGVTQTTFNINYINQNGISKTSPTGTIGSTGWRETQALIPIRLADDDTGVTAVDSIHLAATTGTAGNMGIIIARPLLSIPIPINCEVSIKDTLFGTDPLPQVLNNACLSMMALANSNTVPFYYGSVHIVES